MPLAHPVTMGVRASWFTRLLVAGLGVWALIAVAAVPAQQSAVERGLALLNQGKYAEALEVLNQVIKDEPNNVRAWNARGMTKRRLKDLDGAWDDLTRAIELSPRYASAHNNRGLVRADRGDFEGAIADYNRAIEFNATLSTSFNNRGVAKSKLGDYAGAMADYARAIELAPKDHVPYANRAADRHRAGDLVGARADIQAALALNPTYPFALEVHERLESSAREARGADFDLDAPDPVVASTTTAVTVGDITIRLPVGIEAPAVRIDKTATPYSDAKTLAQVLAQREAALTKEAGVRPRRDEVLVGGLPATRWTWTTRDKQTMFEYAVRTATQVYSVRADAPGPVAVEPMAIRDVLDSMTIDGVPVDQDLEASTSPADADHDDSGKAPPAWTLDKAASARLANPCGPGGVPASDRPLPLPAADGPPDLSHLETTLAQSINRLDRLQYEGAVSSAMQATRILMGPLTPAQEQQVFAAWAPLFDYPTERGLAYLEQLNPLLVEFIALMRGVEAAEAGLEQAQYEAEMAATYDHEPGTRAAMATAMRFVTELQRYKTRIDDVARRVAALGEPPDPMREKCEAQAHTKQALEYLKTLPAPKAAPAEAPAGDDPPDEFLKTAPPSERAFFKGKGYWYWLKLPQHQTPHHYQISVSGILHGVTGSAPHTVPPGFVVTTEGVQDLTWTDRTFTFTKTDPLFTAWKCPAPASTRMALRHVVQGTLSADGTTVLVLTVASAAWACRTVCTHGPERIDKVTGVHNHRPTGEDTKDVVHQSEVQREFVNLPVIRPKTVVIGSSVRGADLSYEVQGLAVQDHIRSVEPYSLESASYEYANKLVVSISATVDVARADTGASTGAAPPPTVSARDQQIAFHTENIRLITEDLDRLRDQLNQARDADSRTFYQYMITSKAADLQRERDAIASVQTGNFTRTMTAWDAMVQGQMVAQSREMAAQTVARPSIEERIDRLIDYLPEGERADMQRWAREQMYGEGVFALNAARVAQSLAEQVRESNERQGRAARRDAAWNEDVISNLESAKTVATYTMYAAPFIASGGTVALAYGLAAGTVSGYQTGGHLGPEAAGTVKGTALAAVTTAARFWAPSIDYSLTFFEGYTAVDAQGQQGGVSGALQSVASTFVKRKLIGTATKALVGRQARLEAARKGARLDEWRDTQRRVAFQQERQAGQALVEQHNRLYIELRQAKQTGATPAQVQQLQTRLMDTTAAIKHSPHAKGYLKFSATADQTAAYAATDRLHTARVLQDFKRDLQANGFNLSGLQFRPIRNAGNTTPGMDLDLAVDTRLTRITVTDPKTQRVSRLPLYEANGRMQEIFDSTYARHSGGRSARASWQMVTTSKHLEAYEDITWLRLAPGARTRPVDPLAALDPRYAADAARVTEIKAHEVARQTGMTRDNRNWEIYRGTSKDITTKVLPLIEARLKTNLTPTQRQDVLQRHEFYTRLSTAMDLANHDPVAAERALRQLTGHQGADLAHMVSTAIASLGTFRRP